MSMSETPEKGTKRGTNLTIQFHGPPLVGASLVTKCFQSLRLGEGHWQQFWAKSPDDEWVELFIPRDQNPRTRATAALGKRALAVVKQMAAEIDFKEPLHLLKFQGYITRSWKPFIWLEPRPDRSFEAKIVKIREYHRKLPRRRLLRKCPFVFKLKIS